MKKLNPSSRLNRRYILINGEKSEIEKTILDYIGVLGWARASPQFINHEGKLVLAINVKSLSDVRAAFEISERSIEILRVSGTLKGLNRKL